VLYNREKDRDMRNKIILSLKKLNRRRLIKWFVISFLILQFFFMFTEVNRCLLITILLFLSFMILVGHLSYIIQYPSESYFMKIVGQIGIAISIFVSFSIFNYLLDNC